MIPALTALLLLVGCKDKADSEDDTGDLDAGTTTVYEDLDQDGYTTEDDCDDLDPAVNPSAAEICDEIDNDCDGVTDEGLTGAYYVDADGDGFGDPSRIVEACELDDGLVENPDDCDDGDAGVNPDAVEVCNEVDDDCDEVVDENDAADAATWFLDEDGDGFGDTEKTTVSCTQPDDYVVEQGDCDDDDDAIHPGALELCNDIDDDCDGRSDEDAADAPTWYRDQDDDGFGVDDEVVVQCDPPVGYVALPGDCDDFKEEINPAAEEICDGIDNDCSAATTEDDLVTFEGVDGTTSDVSSYFTAGTYSSPDGWRLSADGTFYFCRGTYYTYLDLEGDISLVGVYGADETILSAGDQVSVIEISTDGVDAIIQGLTLQDGMGSGYFMESPAYDTGGAVYCAANASLTIEQSVLTASAAEVGGGLYAEGCDVTISESELSDNVGDYGGAIAILDAEVTVSDSVVVDNDASYSGGGIYVDGSTGAAAGVSIVYSTFEDNDAIFGGGIAVIEAGMGCTGSSTDDQGFVGNSATYGGAAFIFDPSSFRSNTCDWGEGSSNNTPHDIYIDPYGDTYDYGDDETFSCSGFACTD